ncbi:MAG: hypothetical protein AB7I04_15250 [Pseudomonadales bacterium]
MRKRVVEVLAVVIGAALVVFYYLDRQPAPSRTDVTGGQTAPVADPVAPASSAQPVFPPVSTPTVTVPDPVTDEAPTAVAAARAAWETARAEVEALRVSLSRLDARFDEKDAEFSRLESDGADPEVLEEQMLIFLDGIVDEYDELEGRLAAAEAAEQEAADRLEALGGDHS